MRKITLMLLVSLMSFMAHAQFEGFEGTWTTQTGTGPGGPAGWALANVAGPINPWIQGNGSTQQPAFAGTKAAFMNSENVLNGTTTEDWLISPLWTVPANGQLRFMSRLFLPGDQLTTYEVRISTVNTGTTPQTTLTNFTNIQTWTELQINPSQLEWAEKIVPLTAYAGQQVYVALIMKGDNGDRWAVDNVRLVSPCPDPTAGVANNIGDTTANLSWANPGGGSTWEVEVVPAAGSPTGTGVSYTGSLPYPATNLQPATQYKFYVRALCGTGDLAVWSGWAGPFNFNTSVCPAAQQCNYTFTMTDSFGDGWNGNTMTISQNGIPMATIGSTFTTGAGPIVVTVPLCTNQPFQLFWNAGGNFPGEVGVSITNTFSQELYNKPAGTGAQNSILFSGQADCANPACLPVSGLTATAPTPTTMQLNWGGPNTGNWQYYVVPNGAPAPAFSATGVATTTKPVTASAVTATNAPLTPDTTYQFYVRVACPGGTFSTWAGPVSFTTTPTCPRPTGLGATGIGDDEATLTWTEAGTATAWEVYVAANNAPAPTATTVGTPSSSTSLLYNTGLTSGTIYQYYVRALCGPGDISTWAGPYTFNTTICNPSDQCTYNFTVWDSFGDGWNGNTMSVRQNGITLATLTLPTGAGPVVIPVSVCNGIPLQLFWNAGGNWAAEVGVSITNNFNQTFFTKPPGTGAQNTSLHTTAAIDCSTAMCLPPTNLTASNPTMTSVQLGWQGPATGNWAYYIVPAGSPAPTATTVPTGTTTTNPVVVNTGLTAATNYQYYVRVICSSTTNSLWAGPFAFNTTVCAAEDQCTYTFRLTDSWGDGWAGGGLMTVYQAGVPVAVLGQNFTTGTSLDVDVPLCPGEEFSLVWTAGGWSPSEMGVVILTPFDEDVYTKEAGEGTVGSTLYTGDGSCTAPPCPKPQNLNVDNLQLTSADFEFTEMGNATSWEVIVVPNGSPAPAPDAAVVPANVITTETTVLDELASGTTYQVYVRALCGGEDGNSNWSGPIRFTTAIVNDDCDGAINVPVNSGSQCVESVPGTVTGATASGIASDCSWMAPEDEVWYSFEATGDTHAININEQVGGSYAFALFEGTCDGLEEVFCNYSSSSIVSDLTVGNTYYIQVYASWLNGNGTGPTSFEVCITTPEPPITVSETQYTVPQLITEVFLGSDCAYVDNFDFKTGINTPPFNTWDVQSTMNGIGYWESNGSSFQFSDPDGTIYDSGIVLVSGDAESDVPGPNDSGIYADWTNGPIKTWLDGLLNTYPEFGPGNQANTAGHTYIKFDFSPLVDLTEGTTLFKFLFASEEYGTPNFECNYSDVFAFVITDLETNEWYNLAVLPNGQLILVTNIHPDNTANGANCPGINEQYFGQYNGMLSPINFNGQGVKMDAVLPVDLVAGHEYRMEMVVANEGDNGVSSAVFLLEGSFNLGEIDLGADMLVDENTAACSQEEVVISTNLDPADHVFTWYLDGVVIPGETGPTITVTEDGVYRVEAAVNGIDCVRTGSIVVEFYPDVEDVTGNPADLTECDADGFAEFDLTENTDAIIAGATVPGATYVVEYYLTEVDANSGTATPLPTTFTNTVQFQQTLYARIENTVSGCFAVKPFDLIIQDNSAEFTINDDFSICAGTTGTITVVPGNFTPADVTISWTKDGAAFAGTGVSVSVTEAGVYEVTIIRQGCEVTESVTVTVTPIPVAQVLPDVTACDSYTLGALTAGNQYFTETNGGGTELFEGDIISATQEIFILASSVSTPACTSESSFEVQIVPTPVIADAEVAPVTACDSYTLPALTVGKYFTEPNGAGTEIAAGTEIEATQTIYVFAEAGTIPCTDAASFTVTITPTPAVTVWPDVAECDIYALPALPAGNAYYTGPNGTGQQLAAGSNIIETQRVYIYAVAAANPDCTAESSFNVVIIPTPEVVIVAGCNGLNQYELSVEFQDDYNPDLVTYSWTNAQNQVVGTGQTLILTSVNGQPALGEGVYHVTVTPFGDAVCDEEAEINVISVMCDLPKGISPNGDGLNDSFDLTALDVRKLVVFNRYGKEVYSFTGNYTDEFAGRAANGENLPSGTYFYMIQRSNGETLTGWVYVNFEE